ncbi:MAG: hypothetical protein D6730_06330 [Bacteroidetes bacterium]|nr:MAG: hypothetical protein D6730_06330 [Bacteroidota bacterium]
MVLPGYIHAFLLSTVLPFWLMLQPQQAHAQAFEFIGPEQGLSQISVRCFLQDELGFMWIGTEDGLNRYDGYEFRVFRSKADSLGLCFNWINSLMQDRHGMIWVGTANGLSVYNPRLDRFFSFYHQPDDSASLSHNDIYELYEDAQGQIWVGTGRGLNLLLRNGQQPAHWKFKRFTAGQSGHQAYLPANSVKGIAEDERNQLWIATHTHTQHGPKLGGLTQLLDTAPIFRHILEISASPAQADTLQIETLFRSKDQKMWVGTIDKGLYCMEYQGDSLLFRHIYEGLPHPFVRALLEDRRGNIWVGTYNGVRLLKAARREQGPFSHLPGITDALPFGQIDALYEDRSGNIWIGGPGGCVKVPAGKKAFQHYRHDAISGQGLANNDVIDLLQDSRGDIWVANYDAGLTRIMALPGGQERYEHYLYRPGQVGGLQSGAVICLTEDRFGHIWVGTFHGLHRLRFPSGPTGQPVFEHFLHQPAQPGSLLSNYVTDLHEDRQGTLWVINGPGGIQEVVRDKKGIVFRPYLHQGSDPFSPLSNWPLSVYEDERGRMWVNFRRGVSRMYRDSSGRTAFRHLLQPQGMQVPQRASLAIRYGDTAGVLWAGGNGLVKISLPPGADRPPWEPGVEPVIRPVFQYYTEAEGLPNHTIYGILPDGQGRLWISTNHGLSCFDPRSETFRNYDQRDGLQSNEFSANAYFRSVQGEMLFGGINGFNRFHPDSIQDFLRPPALAITRIRVLNEEAVVGQPLAKTGFVLAQAPPYLQQFTLSPRDYLLEIHFAALDFVGNGKQQYAYMLEGLDTDWIPSGSRRFATYTNLGPGSYTFRVKASNADGVWNEQGISMAITVKPPWWRTGWAFLLYAGLLAGGVYVLVRMRTQAVRREMHTRARIARAKLEERERVRARSSRDFHDETGNKITKISLYTGLLKQQLSTQQHLLFLDKIEAHLKELAGGMRDFIWVLDPKQDELQAVLHRIRDFGQSLFEHSQTSFYFEQQQQQAQQVPIDLNIKRHLLMIFKEGMNNALKYAHASEVRLKVRVSDEGLLMELTDDGLGFDLKQHRAGHGITNMEHRAREIGARLQLESVPGVGTRLRLELQNHP